MNELLVVYISVVFEEPVSGFATYFKKKNWGIHPFGIKKINHSERAHREL